jgi:glycosyltransferase involved in cell wall biosynthesis
MKIALFTDTYRPQTNGVVAYIEDAVKLLSVDNDVVLFAPGEGRLRRERVSERFCIYWVPSSPFPFYEGYKIASMDYRRVSDLIKKEKPDIVHAHAPVNLGLQGVIAAKRKKIPVVITYHTHFPDYVPHLFSGKFPKVLAKISEYAVKKMIEHVFGMADVVTAPTQELVKELESYGLDNVVHLPNGIDFSKLVCSKDDVAAFKKAHGIDEGKKVAIYLGRISFEKKLDKLLEAFKTIEKEDRVLIVAGGGPSLKRFRKLAADLGARNVVFTGFIEDIAPAYRSADFFVSASDTETFGLTFIEGMHCGMPAIGVNRMGPKELIKNGKNGLLVQPGDVSGLAKAMERMYEDDALRSKLGAEAKKTSDSYSIERSIRETLAIYAGLLKRE